jgi:hypothetical protein
MKDASITLVGDPAEVYFTHDMPLSHPYFERRGSGDYHERLERAIEGAKRHGYNYLYCIPEQRDVDLDPDEPRRVEIAIAFCPRYDEVSIELTEEVICLADR